MSCSWYSGSLLVLLAGTASACHPGEPYDLPTTVGPIDLFLGDTTPTLELPPGQLSRSHHLTLATSSEIAIFVQGLDGSLRLRAMIQGVDLGVSGAPYQESPVLLANRTDRFTIAAGKTLNVVVMREGPETGSSLRYRLFAYPVNRAPEHGTPAIVLGQVRSGEDLETSADIDEFPLVGHEGKSLAAYLSNAGLGAAGSFSLGFFDETSAQEIRGVSAPEMGVPLEDNGTGFFTVAADPLVLRVQGTSNLPSTYTFVVRQDVPGGVAW